MSAARSARNKTAKHTWRRQRRRPLLVCIANARGAVTRTHARARRRCGRRSVSPDFDLHGRCPSRVVRYPADYLRLLSALKTCEAPCRLPKYNRRNVRRRCACSLPLRLL